MNGMMMRPDEHLLVILKQIKVVNEGLDSRDMLHIPNSSDGDQFIYGMRGEGGTVIQSCLGDTI